MTNSEEDIKTEETGAPEGAESSSPAKDKFVAGASKTAACAASALAAGWTRTRAFVASSDVGPDLFIARFDRALAWAKHRFPADTYTSLSNALIRVGHGAVVLATALVIVFGITAAIKHSNWVFVVYGLAVAALLAILQYTAARFLDAGYALIDASPSALRSNAFPDCFALLAEAAGLLVFVSFMLQARAIGQWSLLWVGLGLWCLCGALAYIAINPELTNLTVRDDIRAGEEAIGIFSFFAKALVRIVPLAFGAGTAIGLVGLFFGTWSLMGNGMLAAGRGSIQLIVLCTCLPLLSYIFFAAYSLIVDCLRAILRIPGPDKSI